jgi:hypothetical protein
MKEQWTLGEVHNWPLQQIRPRHDLQARPGGRTKADDVSMANQLPKIILDVRFADGIEVVTSEAQAVAA